MATISSAQDGLASAITTWGTTLTGTTMTFTNGSAAVVGSGTLFTTELAINDYVIGPDKVWYQVLLITDNTHLTLTALYGGTTGSPTNKLKQVTAIPADGDKVNIYNIVTIDGTYTWGDATTTAINIKGGGEIKFSRSVNSDLSCDGELVVESTLTGGTFNMGKSTDPIPTGVYATLNLNATATPSATKYRLFVASTGSNGNYSKFYCYGGVRTVNTRLNGTVSAGATSAVLDDVTGWEVGDDIVISATPTSVANNAAIYQADERQILTINTGTKTITFAALTWTHFDRAYVGNLSSNVTIKSKVATVGSHGGIRIEKGTSPNEGVDSIEIRYTAFKHLGDSTAVVEAFYIVGGGRTQRTWKTFSDCSFYSANRNYFLYAYSFQQNNFSLQNCAFCSLGTTYNSAGIYLSNGCYLGADDTVFYQMYNGTILTGANGFGAMGNTFNRCVFGSSRWTHSGTATGMTWNDCTIFGNITATFASGAGLGNTFNRTNVGVCDWGNSPCSYVFTMDNVFISDLICNDCNINVTSITSPAASQKLALNPTKLVFSNKNGDPLQQEMYFPGGNLLRDNITYKAGTASLRYDAISGGIIPVEVLFKVFAPSGKPITVSGYLRKNTSYGSSTRPYVTLSGLGITASTYTMTDVNDTWEQFTVSGTQTSGTDGMLTLSVVFQSANAGGQAWIDEVSAPTPVAVNSGGFEYWANGQPASIITANYVAPIDVWNVLKTQTTLTGSMGEEVNSIKNDTALIPATL